MSGYLDRQKLRLCGRRQALLRIRFDELCQHLDPVGDALSELVQLVDRPVGCVPFGDVAGACVVDQPLGQRAR